MPNVFGNALGDSLAYASGQSTARVGGSDSLDAFLALNGNFSGVSVARTFAEDRAMRSSALNPMGLPTSSAAQLIGDQPWAPTGGYGYAGASGGITGWKPTPSTVNAGDYGGSMERVARAQLGSGASQRDINNYVGQLIEINGISNPRRVGGDLDITLPGISTPAATSGLGVYGKDIALGEQMKAAARAELTGASAQAATNANGGAQTFNGDGATGPYVGDKWDAKVRMSANANIQTKAAETFQNAAQYFGQKAIAAYQSGDTATGDANLKYAADYSVLNGNAQASANALNAAAPAYKLQMPTFGTSKNSLGFEFKFGAGAYALVGGNIEFTSKINVYQPLKSSFSEFEAGIGVGLGYNAKIGFESLSGTERSAAIPVKIFDYYGSGQTDGTGAISTKAGAEIALPFLTITAAELKAGVQSPLTGVPVAKSNSGGFYEIKYLEPKISPALNFGAGLKWDIFNTSYKRPSQ